VSASVIVNHMTVVHKSSGGVRMSYPDVCKTPMAPSPVPIPYPNVSRSGDAADTADTVLADGNPIMVKDSVFRMSTGDEAGSLLGVTSNKIKGTAKPTMFSMDVKAEGKNVFRQFDLMLGNGNHDPTNDAPNRELQAGKSATAPGQDPVEQKITETKWTREKCKCGDVVGIETKGENLNGWNVLHKLFRMDDNPLVQVGLCQETMAGGSLKLDWKSVYGPWRKTPSKFRILCDSLGGPAISAKPLQIEIPADAEKQMADDVRIQALVPTMEYSAGTWRTVLQNTGKEFLHVYGYHLSLKEGDLLVHCKLKLEPTEGTLRPMAMRWLKSRAKREIESVWDNKFKFHRKACSRGNDCACPGGCCLFPIRVRCEFVESGQHITINVRPGSPPRGHRFEAWDTVNWWEHARPDQGKRTAHEFGHAIGMLDEYRGASIIPEYFNLQDSIMGWGALAMEHHWRVYPSPGESLHTWFQGKAGDTYNILPIS
jgi:hypothetical protein